MSNAPMGYYPPPPPPGMMAPPPPKASNGLATAGFVVGLLGFLGAFIPVINIVGIVLGVIGAILAAVGLAKSGKVGAGKGLGLAGLILGVLAIVIGIVINVVFVKAVGDAVKDGTMNLPVSSATAAAAEGKATPGAAGSSRDNPVPLGSAITGGDWAVTVNSVTTAEKDSLGQTPETGKTLLVVNLTATYNGTDSQGSAPWASIKYVTPDGSTIDGLDGSTLFIADNAFDSLSTVYQGASVTGNKMMEVPAAGWDKGVFAVSPDMLSDDTFVAIK